MILCQSKKTKLKISVITKFSLAVTQGQKYEVPGENQIYLTVRITRYMIHQSKQVF